MKRQKKNVAKVLSVCLAGALTCTGILPVFAGDEAAEKEERDRLVVYLDKANGQDSNEGSTDKQPLKSVKAVREYFEKLEEESDEEQKPEQPAAGSDSLEQPEKEIRLVVLCQETELTESEEKLLEEEGLRILTAEEYQEFLEQENPKEAEPSETPAPDSQEEPEEESQKDQPAVTPSPAPAPEKPEEEEPAEETVPGEEEQEGEEEPAAEEEREPEKEETPAAEETEPEPTPSGEGEEEKEEKPEKEPGPADEEKEPEQDKTSEEEQKKPEEEQAAAAEEEKEPEEEPAPEEKEQKPEILLMTELAEAEKAQPSKSPAKEEKTEPEQGEDPDAQEEEAKPEETPQPAEPEQTPEPENHDSRTASAEAQASAQKSGTLSGTAGIQARTLPGFDLVGGGISALKPGNAGGSENELIGSAGSGNNSVTPAAERPVNTGDFSQLLPYTLSMAVGVLGGGILMRLRLENKRNACRAGYRQELEKFREDCRIQ